MTEIEEKEAKVLQEKEAKELKALGEFAPFWKANEKENTLLQVGSQIFVDDEKGRHSATAESIRTGYDVLEVKRPK